jgi:hypothetical protein
MLFEIVYGAEFFPDVSGKGFEVEWFTGCPNNQFIGGELLAVLVNVFL